MNQGVHRYTNNPQNNRLYIFCEIVDKSQFEYLTRHQEEESFDEPQTDYVEVILKGTYLFDEYVEESFDDEGVRFFRICLFGVQIKNNGFSVSMALTKNG